MQIKMNSKRAGLVRKVWENRDPATHQLTVTDYRQAYGWSIERNGEILAQGSAGTQADARNTVRSTTRFLAR
jgi:hypothetical protein